MYGRGGGGGGRWNFQMPKKILQLPIHIIVTGFVPRLWVMTLWKIFAVNTQLRINREDLS